MNRDSRVTLRSMLLSAVASISLILLAASGAAKVIDPVPTVGAMESAGLPSNKSITRLLGLAEIGAAAFGLILGGVWVLPGALLYLAFGVFTAAATRGRFALQSCGCFGKEDTPPTFIHVAYNFAAALALGGTAVAGRAVIPVDVPTDETVLFLAFALLGAYLSYLLLSDLPKTLAAAATE